MLDLDMLITKESLLIWLEDYSCVLEYSEQRENAFIQDEDAADGMLEVPVTLVRELIAAGELTIWRHIGKWNNGYNTYKPTAWVAAWERDHSPSQA